MFDSMTSLDLAKMIHEEREQEYLEEVRARHLVEGNQDKSPRLRDRLYLRAGDVFISVGRKLQEHARPVVYPISAVPAVNERPC